MIEIGDHGIDAAGTVIDATGTESLRYRVGCDDAWRVRSVQVSGPTGSVHLVADGEGAWTTTSGDRLPRLEGCIDADIQETPFTNTVAIRRLGLQEGESRAIRVAYVPVPTFRPKTVMQAYTCLRAAKLYRYEGFPPGFQADLRVDDDGLVVSYPKLFERI